jgi:uncharacterized membrane protein YdjX (TVP38/TMEM64 family)
MKRWVILSLYGAAACLLLFNRSEIMAWLEADGTFAHDGAIWLLAFVIAVVPAVPYGFVAAIFGAKYGPVTGSLLNLAISVAAAAVLFLLVRYVLTAEQRRKAAGVKGVFRLTAFAEVNPFLAVMIARMVPFVPAQAVNIFAALTRMRMGPYLTATVLGKIPFLVTVSWLGNEMFHARQWGQIMLILGGYGLFLSVFVFLFRKIPS